MFNFSTVKYFLLLFIINLNFIYAIEILPNTEPHHIDADFNTTEELALLDQQTEGFLSSPPSYQRSQRSSTTKIMLLGDSITYGSGSFEENGTANSRYGYRNFLYHKLKYANYNFYFVGSRSAGFTGDGSFDTDHEGYPGITSEVLSSNIYKLHDMKKTYLINLLRKNKADTNTDIEMDKSYIYNLLQMNKPHIILLHIGTNDTNTSPSIDGLKNLLNNIDQFESDYNHHIKILLAKIIPSTNSSRNKKIKKFNENLVGLVNERVDDIEIVDMYSDTNISTQEDFYDQLHPNDEGYRKMASVWFSSVSSYLTKNDYGWFPTLNTYFLM